jgi:subtilase family serine protease
VADAPPQGEVQMRTRWRGVAVSATVVAVTAAIFAVPGLAGASGTGARVTLRGSQPGYAARSRAVSAVSTSATVGVRVYLAPKGGQAALAKFAMAVSTPGSAQYRRFLTPAQYRARFAPPNSSVASASAWLRSSGMRVTGVAAGNRYVSATGSAAAAQRAFGVSLGMYRVRGKMLRAPTSDLSIPASLRGVVMGVTGLESTPLMRHTTRKPFPPPAGFRNARPCSMWYGEVRAKYQADYKTPLPKFEGKIRTYAPCGYVPSQFRSAYGVDDAGYTGDGVTVAITDAFSSPWVRQDADRYATDHGDAAFRPGQFSKVRPDGNYRFGFECGGGGWYQEETLDVEAVHGMAPDANVMYYAARSCSSWDLLNAMARIVDDNQASIVTNSWGLPSQYIGAGLITAYEQVLEQGATQGIGFLFSSGDNGDEVKNTGLLQTDFPVSDPWVTGVGGTSTGIDSNGGLSLEAGWGTNQYALSSDGKSWNPFADPPFRYGAGGGFSHLYNRPDYQDGVVPPSSPSGRAVPDVSLDGDPNTGMLIGETQSFPGAVYYDVFRIGGTSLSSPLFAGMQADASEAAGGRLGFANPAIYQLARDGVDAFNDVLPNEDAVVRADFANNINGDAGIRYSVRTFDDDSSLWTAEGWDPVTGIGTPNATYITSYEK